MNRRALFKGLAGAATALILPPTLAENAEAGKRYWALGGIPKDEGLLSWQSDVVPNAVERLGDYGKANAIDMDELIHTCRLFHETYFPVGHPMREMWLNMRLIPHAASESPIINAGYQRMVRELNA
jgi:hypothetical protein